MIGYNSEKGPFQQSLVPIEQVVSDEKIFKEFFIGSNVKLSSAVAAILVSGWGHRIQF